MPRDVLLQYATWNDRYKTLNKVQAQKLFVRVVQYCHFS